MPNRVEILNGDHDVAGRGNLPYMVVDRLGLHVDLVGIGQLWDAPTVSRVEWGLRTLDGRVHGAVSLKSGQRRPFFDIELMTPYLNAFYLERERLGLGSSGPFLRKQRPAQLHS